MKQKTPYFHWLVITLQCLLGGLILSLPTFINQFPFLYYDSGFYFLTGLFQVQPWLILWRPIIYGLVMGNVIAATGSLALVVVVQNILLSGFLYIVCRIILKQSFIWWHFFVILVGTYLTPLPWVCNFILPDFFSGLLPLLLASLFLIEDWRKKAFVAVMALTSLSMHHSNMIASAIASPFLWFHSKSSSLKRVVVIVLVLPWLLVPIIHGIRTSSFSISNASQAIIFSRFIAFGIAQPYLGQMCQDKKIDNQLCQYNKSNFDLWTWANETYKTQSAEALKQSVNEFKEINIGILTSRFLFVYIKKALSNSLHQALISSTLLDIPQYSKLIENELRILGPKITENYKNQKMTDKFFTQWSRPMEFIYNFTGLLSWIFLILLWWAGRLNQEMKTFTLVCTTYYIANALTIGFFTEPMSRYSIRLSWIFFVLYMIQLIIMRQAKTSKTKET